MVTVFKKLNYERLICYTHKLACKKFFNFLHLEQLKSRTLIQVEGPNADEFLQGMITNDIKILNDASSIYTMFLNVQGRILFDSFIFKYQSSSYIIDCDSTAVQPLINHLKLHKVRRKITFKPLEKEMKVCALFDKNINDINITDQTNSTTDVACLSESFSSILPDNAIVARDCRLHYLGDRLLLPLEFSLSELSNILVSEGDYKLLRFKLGIGEGVEELKRGKSLPLEANCDYLHGVSFQKGCYIGQELTARTYHTGVVRKRYMPLIFSGNNISLQPNSNIVNDKGKSVGKTIVSEGKYGIGLMRIAESLESTILKIGEVTVQTFKPAWWPTESAMQN